MLLLLLPFLVFGAPCTALLTATRLLPPLPPFPQLTSWLPGAGVRCVGAASDVFLRMLQAGQGWETPRPPFEVQLHLEARAASTTGRPGEGQPYFSSSGGEPLSCSLGAGQLPPGGCFGGHCQGEAARSRGSLLGACCAAGHMEAGTYHSSQQS